jgi:hypothetical protein
MKGYIQKLLKEALNEANFGEHSVDRFKERFSEFSDEDIPQSVKQGIIKNLDTIEATDFPTNKSYGVMLGSIPVNKESQYYKAYLETVKDGNTMGKGGSYYSIMGDKKRIIKDSTGNQFWVVIRNNEVTTFMLRKDVQTNDANYNIEKLRVDNVIKNLPEFVKRKAPAPVNNTRFKKIKLSDGTTIRHYEALNKFETLQGQPIKVDDIFDSLPEDLQSKVMELMESIELPVEVGDTVLMGKFKNKKVVVKDIEWDEEKGDLKINGKPALKMRIIKKLDKVKK